MLQSFYIVVDILNESPVEPDSTTFEPDSTINSQLTFINHQKIADTYDVIELGRQPFQEYKRIVFDASSLLVGGRSS